MYQALLKLALTDNNIETIFMTTHSGFLRSDMSQSWQKRCTGIRLREQIESYSKKNMIH